VVWLRISLLLTLVGCAALDGPVDRTIVVSGQQINYRVLEASPATFTLTTRLVKRADNWSPGMGQAILIRAATLGAIQWCFASLNREIDDLIIMASNNTSAAITFSCRELQLPTLEALNPHGSFWTSEHAIIIFPWV